MRPIGLLALLSVLYAPQVPFTAALDDPIDAKHVRQWTKVLTVEPDMLLPGQSATFRWPAGATRVTASGGGFGYQKSFAGQTMATDTVYHTTTYRFNLWYPEDTSPSGIAGLHHPVGHQEVEVTVPVYRGNYPAIKTYHSPHRWGIDYLADWKYFDVPFDDPANNDLIYFEREEDSMERLAVAIVPVGRSTSADLLRKAISDGASDYDSVTEVQQKSTIQCGVPATWMTFRGVLHGHADDPIRSMVLVFIRNHRGFVVSARTLESQYSKRANLLHCLVRSITETSVASPQK